MEKTTKTDQVDPTHRHVLSDNAKNGRKIAAIIGVLLLAGAVSASASGALFSFKAVPMISGLLVGASAAGALVGGGVVLDHRRRRAEEALVPKEAESQFSKEDLQYGAVNGAMTILRMMGDDSKLSPLAAEGVFERTDQSEATIKRIQKELCEGRVFALGAVSIHTLAIVFIRIHNELELLGGDGVGASIDTLVEAIENGEKTEAAEQTRHFLLDNLDEGEIDLIAGFITVASELVEAQKRLPAGQGMDLDSVARLVASNLRNITSDAETQKFQKIVRFMIENHESIFANPIDEE